MQIVNISGLYNVSPQISSTDIEILSEKGFEKIICNRPDFEVHPNIQSNLIKKVAIDGTVSKPVTISKIDGGRGTGVPQLEVLEDEIFIVWTVFDNESNQLKTVKLSSNDV